MLNRKNKSMASDGEIEQAYAGYLNGRESLRAIAKRFDVTEHYIYRLANKMHRINLPDEVVQGRINLIQMAEEKLIERARLLQVGKGSVRKYRELLFYVCKADVNSSSPFIIPTELL